MSAKSRVWPSWIEAWVLFVDTDGATRTTIECDELGPVASVAREGRVTTFESHGPTSPLRRRCHLGRRT